MDKVFQVVNHARYIHVDEDLGIFFVWYGDRVINIHSIASSVQFSKIGFSRTPVIEHVQWQMEDWCARAKENN